MLIFLGKYKLEDRKVQNDRYQEKKEREIREKYRESKKILVFDQGISHWEAESKNYLPKSNNTIQVQVTKNQSL